MAKRCVYNGLSRVRHIKTQKRISCTEDYM